MWRTRSRKAAIDAGGTITAAMADGKQLPPWMSFISGRKRPSTITNTAPPMTRISTGSMPLYCPQS